MARRSSVAKRGIHPVDKHVGSRIRDLRIMRGLTQQKVASGVGVTFQQLQKYENGTNRVSSSMLHSLSLVLGAPVSYFFDDLPGHDEGKAASQRQEMEEKLAQSMVKRETLELMRAYNSIEDEKLRRSLFSLIKAIPEKKKS